MGLCSRHFVLGSHCKPWWNETDHDVGGAAGGNMKGRVEARP